MAAMPYDTSVAGTANYNPGAARDAIAQALMAQQFGTGGGGGQITPDQAPPGALRNLRDPFGGPQGGTPMNDMGPGAYLRNGIVYNGNGIEIARATDTGNSGLNPSSGSGAAPSAAGPRWIAAPGTAAGGYWGGPGDGGGGTFFFGGGDPSDPNGPSGAYAGSVAAGGRALADSGNTVGTPGNFGQVDVAGFGFSPSGAL